MMLGQPVFGADGGCYDKLPVVSRQQGATLHSNGVCSLSSG